MELHEDWASESLGQILELNYGKGLTKAARREGDFPVYGSNGVVGTHDESFTDAPCVIVGRKGAAGEVHLSKHPCWPIDTTYFIDDFGPFDPTFALYALRGMRLGRLETSTAIPGLNRDDAYREPIWIPPLLEQRAIVAKIESLFSELDQGVAQLEAVRTQLGRYRQSVLKAAFEGRLTAAWREQRRRDAEASPDGPGEPRPTAAALLARIHAERDAAYAKRLAEWEQSVADWEGAGPDKPGKASGQKKPRKPAKPKDPPPLTPEELADLPGLPEGWVWCRLGLGIEDPQYGTSKKCRYDTPGRSVLRIPNMNIGRIDPTDLKFAEFDDDETQTYELRPNDVLIIRSNGSVSLVGRPALITERDTKHLFAGYLVRLRPVSAVLRGDYLTQCLLSHRVRVQIESAARSTSGVNNINSGEMRSLVVPMCSPDEQTEIVNEIDARLSVVEKIEEVVATALKQAEALRQSILKKAFEGRLLSEAERAAVRADPDYEPADQLLARIRGDAAQQKKSTASKRSRSRPVAVSIPKGERYRQAACAAYAVKRLGSKPTFGRVQQMKYLYLVPHLVEQESHIHAERQAAGPLDPAIHKIESLAKKQGWFTVKKSGQRYIYTASAKCDEACEVAERFFGAGKANVDWLLDQFAKFDTEQAELVATTFAVWNDCLIDNEEPTESAIVAGVHGWHPDKVAKFPADRIGKCMKWLRDNDLVPTGTGPRTRETEEVS